jgi:hypothetical protein
MPNIKKSNKTGKFIKHVTYVKKICENCNIEFEIKASSLKYGRGKCCSRKCVDENKKRTYSGKNNPSYGRIQSESERKKRHQSVQSAILKKYGKTSVELMQIALGSKSETSIERKLYECLEILAILYEKKYKIWITNIHYKEYDAYVPSKNLLIEVDGDYWHGNPTLYTTLNEQQIKMVQTDIFKEELAKQNNMKLVRFWQSEVETELFLSKLKEVVC